MQYLNSGNGLTLNPARFDWGNADYGSLNGYSTAGASLAPQNSSMYSLVPQGQGFGLGQSLPGIGGGGAVPTGAAGAAGAAANSGIFGGLGMNIPTLRLGLGALSSLGNIYGAFQANKLARDNFNFTKDVTNTNLNNQIKSYNTTLEDRARSRATQEGRDQASADAYIAANRLSR